MNSVSIEIQEVPLLDNNGEMNQSQMDSNLFKAAAAGNPEPFRDMARDAIERLSTAQTKNTILHINIISQKTGNVSTKFVEEILETFPSLLLQVNAKGDTPLHVAAKFGHSEIVSVLIERAKLPQRENEGLERRVRAAREMIRMRNKETNTALHEAACHGSFHVVKILTKEDPDYPYSANNYGKTPLYMAAEYGSSDMVLALLENCTSVSHEGPNGKTALHAAAVHLDFDDDRAMQQLFEKLKNLIKENDHYGWTPIHYAAYHNQDRQIRGLLELDQTATNVADEYRKMTALHLAAGQGHAKTVETILSLTPECYELVDDRGRNFLHYAMVSFSVEDLKKLLEKNPLARSLINEGDAKGNTPLHVLAAVHQYKFDVDMIRKTKANYHAVNEQNDSVEHMLKYGYPELKEEIQKLLEDVGRGNYSDGARESHVPTEPDVLVQSAREARVPTEPDVLVQSAREARVSTEPNVLVQSARESRVSKEQKAEIEDYLKHASASHLVVAALIATVAFAAAFTIPGGYKSENGTAILRSNRAFQAFIVADSIALVFSLSAVFAHFWQSAKIRSTKEFDKNLFDISAWLTLFSMGAMAIAFVTGTYAMLAPSSGLAIIICLIGLSFFLLMFSIIWISF